MPDDVKTPAVSSPAEPLTITAPTDADSYAKWRLTGERPAPPKPEASAASKSAAPAHVDASGAENLAASEADQQESRGGGKPRANAETRLTELLADLKRAGLTPAELKTFKREAAAAAAGEKTPAASAPADEPKAPKKPEMGDFDDYTKYEEAVEKWPSEMAEFLVDKKLRERDLQTQKDSAKQKATERLAAASARYGDGASQTIIDTSNAIFSDQAIPAAIRQVFDDSPVIADLMYVLGSKGELADFVALSKSNPGEAIRKAILMEHLVKEELAAGKSGASESGASAPAKDPVTGKFLPPTPATKTTKAPPPPVESSGRGSAPADEVETAAKASDFSTFRSASNRRDIARHNGR